MGNLLRGQDCTLFKQTIIGLVTSLVSLVAMNILHTPSSCTPSSCYEYTPSYAGWCFALLNHLTCDGRTAVITWSCPDELYRPARTVVNVVLPRKPCLYQADMACYHVTNKEVGMYQEEMWIWQHRFGHYQNSRRHVELL